MDIDTGNAIFFLIAGIFVGLPLIGVLTVPFYLSGKGGEGDHEFNPEETPDAIFVRATKRLLIALVMFIFIGSIEYGNSTDNPSFQWGLASAIVLPPTISYVVGIRMAHSKAKNRAS